MKKTVILFLILSMFSCTNKRENINRLNSVMKSIDNALTTTNRQIIENTLLEIEPILDLYPEHRLLRYKKATLEIRLREYERAISTIENILEINPDEIDYRITKGILEEIIAHKAESIESFEEALYYAENNKNRPSRPSDTYTRLVNRVLILKLLNRDTDKDYYEILDDNEANKYPDVIYAINLLKDSPREQLINKYR